jgi:hypothetical protein
MGNCFVNNIEDEENACIEKIIDHESKIERHQLYLLMIIDNIENGSNITDKPKLKELQQQCKKLDDTLEKYDNIKSMIFKKQNQRVILDTTKITNKLLKEIQYSTQFDYPSTVLHRSFDFDVVEAKLPEYTFPEVGKNPLKIEKKKNIPEKIATSV